MALARVPMIEGVSQYMHIACAYARPSDSPLDNTSDVSHPSLNLLGFSSTSFQASAF